MDRKARAPRGRRTQLGTTTWDPACTWQAKRRVGNNNHQPRPGAQLTRRTAACAAELRSPGCPQPRRAAWPHARTGGRQQAMQQALPAPQMYVAASRAPAQHTHGAVRLRCAGPKGGRPSRSRVAASGNGSATQIALDATAQVCASRK